MKINKYIFFLLMLAFSLILSSNIQAKSNSFSGEISIYLLDSKNGRTFRSNVPTEIFSQNCNGKRLPLFNGNYVDSAGHEIQTYIISGSDLKWDTWKGIAKICVKHGSESGSGEINFINAERGNPTPILLD